MVRAMEEEPGTLDTATQTEDDGEQIVVQSGQSEPKSICDDRESSEGERVDVITDSSSEENNIAEIFAAVLMILIVSVVVVYNKS